MADKNMEAQISVEFEEATSRQSLNSGETINTLWSKVKRWLSDLKTVCFSGSYNDLSDKPTTATTETDGFMSADDKSKLDSADDTYALKSKYGDTTINVGRKTGTDVGDYSTAEGYNTTANGKYSHSEGEVTTASGEGSHAEGIGTKATGRDSHAEGAGSVASGSDSHAGGNSSIASGLVSFSHGIQTSAQSVAEVAFGKYNISRHDTLFSIGDGSADDARHNAFEITTNGGKLHDKDIATTDLIPTSLPANGGDADTVDGLHANDFTQIIDFGFSETDTKTAIGYSGKTTLYRCVKWTDYPIGCYDGQGTVIAINYSGAGTVGADSMWVKQIFISAHAKGSIYIRYISETSVGEWKEISTTPIKSTTFSSTADGTGNFNLWAPSENKVPISIQLDNKIFYAIPFLYNNQMWLGSTISEVTRQPVTDTTVSGTVYYIEV